MKRIFCVAIALLLGLAGTTLAESVSVPSKTAIDLTKFEVTAENLPEDANLFLIPVNAASLGEALPEYQEYLDICQEEIEKLTASESVEAYFGTVVDSNGNPVSLKELLGTDTLNVYEFCPAIAGGYDPVYGKVTATLLFSTPYGKDEKVIVLIGLVAQQEDGTRTVTWHAFEGIGLEAVAGQEETAGRIQVELTPEIVEAIQSGIAMMAIVSK